MDYETEEQQVEALKKWWAENRNTIIGGIAAGIIMVVGWRYYNTNMETHAEQASQSYENILQTLSTTSDLTSAQSKVNELYASFSDTPYASLSALALAKKQLQAGEQQHAIQQLEWVINNTQQAELEHIARLRLARVLLSEGASDKALMVLDLDYPESFTALYEELKGDVYVSKGELDQARAAYDKAILSSAMQAGKWLILKRDNLGSFTAEVPNT